MKTLCRVAICVGLLALASCGKDSNNPQHAANSITATLDSLSFSSLSTTAQEVRVGVNGSAVMTGTDKDGNEIVIEFTVFVTGQKVVYGSNVSGQGGVGQIVFIPNGSTDPFSSSYFEATTNGTAEISEIDTVNKIITGIFNTRMSNLTHSKTISLTNGVFTKIPYTVQTNKVNAKIDGQDFNAIEITSVGQAEEIWISAFGPLGAQIISLQFPLATGTYAAEAYSNICNASYAANFGTTYFATSGSVTVTSIDKTKKIVNGTFGVTVSPYMSSADDIAITSGSFSIGY